MSKALAKCYKQEEFISKELAKKARKCANDVDGGGEAYKVKKVARMLFKRLQAKDPADLDAEHIKKRIMESTG